MARAIWTGWIRFGLVNVPVRLYTATQSHRISFHQLSPAGRRIRYKRVEEGGDEEVPYEDIVKGYEFRKGQYVTITPEELEKIAPHRSRSIEVEEFVDLDDIDPIVWDRTYYLGPERDEGAQKPYALLMRALEESGRVAIARFVMRGKQHLATIRPLEGVLGLETMYYADEIRDVDVVENRPEDVSLSRRELDLAVRLVDDMTREFEHEEFEDTYHERVRELAMRKAEGEAIVVEEPEEESGQVIDLVSALRRSLGQGRKRAGAGERADLRALSKSELYDRAAAAGVAGRSRMSKEELAEALEEAS